MKSFFLSLSLLIALPISAQENLSYKTPPKEILELADYQRPPSVVFNSKRTQMLFVYRDTYKTLAQLSEKDMKLAGLRVNPITRIASTTSFITQVKLQKTSEKQVQDIKNLPQNPKIAYLSWSPKEDKIAFIHATDTQLELWMIDIENSSAKKLSSKVPNAAFGNPINWLNNEEILTNCVPENTPNYLNEDAQIKGPITSESKGVVSQNRTYQDLLKNPQDEQNFRTLVTSEVYKINTNGTESLFLPKNLYTDISISPNEKYIMVESLKTPFSYIVPYNRFPQEIVVYDSNGNALKKIHEQGLQEVIPKGFMAVSKENRSWQWRDDLPASLVYVAALDGGDPEVKTDFRDQVYQWDAPFTQEATPIFKTKLRFSNISWGNQNVAVFTENWYDTRQEISTLLNPTTKNTKTLWDRNYQDSYSDPGTFIFQKNAFGRYVLQIENNHLLLNGDGFTKEGQFPFIDELNLATLKKHRIYTSSYTDKKEDLLALMDYKNKTALVMLQSPKEFPNYYIKSLKTSKEQQITQFQNPFLALKDVDKRILTYKRNDGVALSGVLYLPKNAKKDNRLPLLIWAYPREFKDKSSAGQVTKNSNQFTYPSYGSFIYWVNKGYAVLDDAAFPILGEGKQEPNDTFITQLVANADAAIKAVADLGYINTKKVAVGGHSYGAFMTANLLTHSQLFTCGIARSGAYNRTLTPFGFQSEQRNYWDAKEVYNSMSPFMNAEKMKTPMLLVHGEADNNPGTFTLQTERYFQALKGLGAPVRMVILPKESHGYVAKENIFHLLWEQDQFLSKCLK